MRTMAREEDVANLRRRLRLVQADGVRRWGRMNAHQMVCHLGDSFRMATGDYRPRPVSQERQSLRTLLKWSALYWGIPWPRGFPTIAEADQERAGTRPTDFTEDLARAEEEMDRFLAASPDWPHPFFGLMSRSDWLRWGWLHTDHHLHQFSF